MVAAAIDLDFHIFLLGLFRGKSARPTVGKPLSPKITEGRYQAAGWELVSSTAGSSGVDGCSINRRVFYSNQTKCK